MVTGATVPWWESATALSPVMRARAVAALTTKISGLPWRSAISTVAPTARKSCGLGRGGTSTRAAWATTPGMDWGVGEGGRRTHHRDLDAGLLKPRQRFFEIRQPRLDEVRRRRPAGVPPMGQ